jgi:hypothetical protein
MKGWGASDVERRQRLPGDGIVPAARDQETRAITIEAPAEQVWAWIAQLGQDRAGFYSYQLLENLIGCEMPDVRTLDPRLGRWAVGDKLWMYPRRKAGGQGFATLAVLEPGRALAFATRQIGTGPDVPADGSWTFVVQPIDERASRLIVRGRGGGGLRLAPALFTAGVFEPMHFAMERRTMTSVKDLAEGRRTASAWDTLQVASWTVVFFSFVGVGIAALIVRRPARALAAFILLGLAFQLLTLVQPHPAVGAALLLLLAIPPAWPRGWARAARSSRWTARPGARDAHLF